MQLEFHQLDRRWEHLRARKPERQRRLMASLAAGGQQTPIVVVAVVGQPDRYLVIDGYKCIAAIESNAVVLSLYEAQMSALAILSQPRKRSVVRISESRPGHFALIRRLPN